MPTPLNVLMLEDNPDDAELILLELDRAGFAPTWRRVETETDFLSGLSADLDIILADFSQPSYDALRALAALHASGLSVPFIVITGHIGDEQAVKCIQQGADDYLIKDRLARLGSAVRHALEETSLRQEKRKAETELRASLARMRRIVESSLIGFAFMNADGTCAEANQTFLDMIGYSAEELRSGGVKWTDLTPPEYRERDRAAMVELQSGGAIKPYEKEYFRKDLSRVPVLLGAAALEGAPGELVSFVLEITERKRQDEALRQAHAELERRVEERTAELARANLQLQEAKVQADGANKAKSEFLSRMSHELRTPLNAILGFAQVLAMEETAPSTQDAVEFILKGGEHLLNLINEVLDISRIEAGRMELSIEPVALEHVLAESLSLVRPLAAPVGVELPATCLSCSGTHVMADANRLKQVLINLLVNAVKYNRPGGRVSVTCRLEGRDPEGHDRVRLEVGDTGPGLTSDQISRLFVPFERLSADRSGVEGTGLGLALSRRLMDAMGGAIGVESVPGEGSTFYVEIPLAESPGLTVAAAAASEIHGAPDLPERPFLVLSIEDNPSNSKLIQVVLSKRRGVKLLNAIQGSVGLDLARYHRPDVILLDLHLPDMHGSQVLQTLRGIPETASTPVVIVSADATHRQIESLLAAGAHAYLTKPLDVEQLLRLIDGLMVAHTV